jgi:hypothetical protein
MPLEFRDQSLLDPLVEEGEIFLPFVQQRRKGVFQQRFRQRGIVREIGERDLRLDLPGPGAGCDRPGGVARSAGGGQLATRTLATSVMTSPGSDAGWAWTSPEICPPHSISIWP